MTRSQQIIINRIADIDDPVLLNEIATVIARYDTIYVRYYKLKKGFYEVKARFRGVDKYLMRATSEQHAKKIKAHYELHGNIKI